jgi:hypothetical protein
VDRCLDVRPLDRRDFRAPAVRGALGDRPPGRGRLRRRRLLLERRRLRRTAEPLCAGRHFGPLL